MAFQFLNSGAEDRAFERVPKTTAAVTAKGDVMEWAAGATGCTRADSGTTLIEAHSIAMEVQAAADTDVLVLRLKHGDKFLAELANNSAAADNGDAMVLTDYDTLNNTGTNSAAITAFFRQMRPYGAAADNKAVVEFIGGVNQVTA